MSVAYRAVQWNRDKLVYDGVLIAAVATYIAVFLVVGARLEPPKDVPGAIDLRHPRLRQLRVPDADRDPVDRPAGAARSALPAAALQSAAFRRADLLRRRRACLVHDRLVSGHGRVAEPRHRAHHLAGLRQVHRLSVQGARHRGAAGAVRDGVDQPRFLAGLPHAARSGKRCTWRSTSPMGCW